MNTLKKFQTSLALSLGLAFAASAGAQQAEPAHGGMPPQVLKMIEALAKKGPPSDDERVVRVTGIVTPAMLDEVRDQVTQFNKKASDKPIKLEINSPGGDGITMFNLEDVVGLSTSPIQTHCYGRAQSAGFYLLMAGKKGERSAVASCDLLAHNVQIGLPEVEGPGVKAIEIHRKQDAAITRSLDQAYRFMTYYTGLDAGVVKTILSLDCRMTPQMAKKLNVIDHVIDFKNPDADKVKVVATQDNVCMDEKLPQDIVDKINAFKPPVIAAATAPALNR